MHLGEELAAREHEVRVVAIAGDGEGLPVEVAGNGRGDLGGLARVLRATRWSDVVIGSGSTTLLVGATAARVARRPFVYRSIGDPSFWGQVRLADLRVGAPARSADRVVALYPAAATVFRTCYRVPTARLTTITNGVPAEDFEPASASDTTTARVTLGLDPDRPWIGFVGASSPEKDPMLAIEAMRLLDGPGLVIAGDGPLAPEARRAAEALGDRVRFLGAHDDVAVVYSAIDVLVVPSRSEGVPAVAIEAALSGVPVVATEVGGVSSVVVDGSTGRLVDGSDVAAVAAALVESLDRRSEWGRRARDLALDHFTMEVVGREWADVIAEVLSAPRRRR